MKLVTWNLPRPVKKYPTTGDIGYLPLDKIDALVMTGTWEVNGPDTKLSRMNLKFQTSASTHPESSQILIASANPLTDSAGGPVFRPGFHWMETYLPAYNLKIMGVTITGNGEEQSLADFEQFADFFQSCTEIRAVVCGSFSVPAGNQWQILDWKRHFQNLANLGWVDARRVLYPITYEQLWFSNAQKDFQLDLTFLSPSIRPLLINAYHSRIYSGVGFSQSAQALVVELR